VPFQWAPEPEPDHDAAATPDAPATSDAGTALIRPLESIAQTQPQLVRRKMSRHL